MNKYINTITISVILMAFIAMTPVFVSAEVINDGNDTPSDPASNIINDANDEIVNNPFLSNDGNDTESEETSGRIDNGENDEEVNNPFLSNDGNDGDQVPETPVTPPVVPPTTPVDTTTPDTSNRSSGSGSSRNRSSNTNTLPTTNNVIASCTYINDYLTYGASNNSTEVTKLQSFLKETENINVDVNGSFDQKTFNAVKAFQVKYSNDILTPWGQTNPSGRVFYTTKKKINEIFCKTNFALTPAQLAEIATVKRNTENLAAAARVAPASTVAPASSPINTPVEEIVPAENVIDSSEIGSTETNASALTASAADAPSTNVIIRFFKWLFGY